MNKPIKVAEGLWFAVPLRDKGYGIGLTARMEPGRGIRTMFCYFFPQRYISPPSLESLFLFSADDACWLARTGSKDLKDGNWPILGHDSNWDKDAWPMPSFVRQDVVSKKYRKTTYEPDNPAMVIWEGLCPIGEELLLPSDGLNGGGAVELYLTKLIKDNESE